MPPVAGGCSPCGGTPPRTMPTPCDPPPAPGGRAAGLAPTRVTVSTVAPAPIRLRMIPAWFIRAAHMSAVCATSGSATFTFAPRSRSRRTASALSALTAAISSVSPAASVAFASAFASSRRASIAALPFCAAT